MDMRLLGSKCHHLLREGPSESLAPSRALPSIILHSIPKLSASMCTNVTGCVQTNSKTTHSTVYRLQSSFNNNYACCSEASTTRLLPVRAAVPLPNLLTPAFHTSSTDKAISTRMPQVLPRAVAPGPPRGSLSSMSLCPGNFTALCHFLLIDRSNHGRQS